MSKRLSNVREEDEDHSQDDAVNECVRFIVSREGSKIPIKRTEVIQHLASACQTPANCINTIVTKANEILKTVYGYKIVQVKIKNNMQYIIVLTEECESLPSHIPNAQNRRLLVAALLHIFMSGGPVKEDDMWKFLDEAGLLEIKDYTGRKVLTHTFTKQMYLLYTKVGEGDLAKFEFEWGHRATEEVPKIFLLKKMAQALNKNAEHWFEQYREATQVTEPEPESTSTNSRPEPRSRTRK